MYNLFFIDPYEACLRDSKLERATLSQATLSRANLKKADFTGADLGGADLQGAVLTNARLTAARLKGANLYRAVLTGAHLTGVELRNATLAGAVLARADLRGADLRGVNLRGAQLIEADLRNAALTGSKVYGAAVSGLKVDDRTKQQDLVITDPLINLSGDTIVDDNRGPLIRVDNLKVAQFIHLLLNNQEIRDVIDTLTSKAVLILGRFSEERKPFVDALRDEFRKHHYLPILFDFPPSANQTTLEAVKTLAPIARFVVADLTDARSVLVGLRTIVSDLPSVAALILLKKSEYEHDKLGCIRGYSSVVGNTYRYENAEEVIASIKENIIVPTDAKVRELRREH